MGCLSDQDRVRSRAMDEERHSSPSSTPSKFVSGMVYGAALGATCAVLFAPRSGSSVRRQLADGASRLRARASRGCEGASWGVSDFVSRSRRAIERGREAFGATRRQARPDVTAPPPARPYSTEAFPTA